MKTVTSRISLGTVVSALLLFLIFIVPGCKTEPDDQVVYPVRLALTDNPGFHFSITTDSRDNVHLIYVDKEGNKFMHMSNESGKWESEVITSISSDDNYNFIAADASDDLHVSYWENSSLKYVRRSSGSWGSFETVDDTGTVGRYSSLALDSSDDVHISYYDDTNTSLKYAYHNDVSWVVETVDSSAQVGRFSSIALDTNNDVHISYEDNDNDHLKYAVENSLGGWDIETIDSANGGGLYTSIAIDSTDTVHISHHGDLDLKYAEGSAGNWTSETVESNGWNGRYTSIDLDKDGYSYMSYSNNVYVDGSNKDYIKYATNAGGSWNTYMIDDSGNAGPNTAITVDSKGHVHVVYKNDAQDCLMYYYK